MHGIAPKLQPNHSSKHAYYIKPTNKYILTFIHLDMSEPFSVAELSLKTSITFPCVSKVPTGPTALGKQSEFLALFQVQSEGTHKKNVYLRGSQTSVSNMLKKTYCFSVKNGWFFRYRYKKHVLWKQTFRKSFRCPISGAPYRWNFTEGTVIFQSNLQACVFHGLKLNGGFL